MNPQAYDLAIVGGGIAGLAAAYYSQQALGAHHPAARILLIEKDSRWGGKILTRRQEGFVIEGGPDTFIRTKPWGLELCRQLGLENELLGADAERRNVFVLHRGRLVPLPEGLAMMVPTRVGPMLRTPLLSARGKMRMALDLVLPPRRQAGDETLADFISRRLGGEVYERLIEPLMSGIYAGDGRRLSLQATFPFLRDWETRHGSLARGAWAMRRGRNGGTSSSRWRSIFLSPRQGMEQIVERLLRELKGVERRAATRAVALQPAAGGYLLELDDGQSLKARAVILAAPAYAAAEILAALDPQLAAELAAIEYVTTATVSLIYRQSDFPPHLVGHGYVIPRAEGRAALACTWTHMKFPHRAPAGYALLRVFLGRAGGEGAIPSDPQALRELAIAEVRQTLGMESRPLHAHVYHWQRAMPQYNLGHLERLQRIEDLLAEHAGLFLAGAAYRGVGVPDCIRSGRAAAESAARLLAGQEQPDVRVKA